jgi:hypothetical protein
MDSRQADEEEDVSSYWAILREREDTGNWKRKHYVALCGELVLEEAMDLSSDTLPNERTAYLCSNSYGVDMQGNFRDFFKGKICVL